MLKEDGVITRWLKNLGTVWTGAAIGCVEESRKELEFQVYCFIALRLWPRHLMPLSLSLLVYKDERMIELAAKAGMRMPRWCPSERVRGAGSRWQCPLHQSADLSWTQTLKGTSLGVGETAGQSIAHASRDGQYPHLKG